MKSKAFNRYKAYLYLLPSILILTVFTIYPLIKAIVMSFQEGYSIIDGSFDGINLANYIELFSDDVFVKALTNTSIYVVFVVPVSIILSLVLAVLINDTVRAKPVFQTIYFLPYVTSVIAIGIVWSWIFNSNYGKAGPANSAITVVYYIYDKFYNSNDYGVASAAAVVLFVIILALTMLQRAVTRDKEAA